jgi:hypothetical protein
MAASMAGEIRRCKEADPPGEDCTTFYGILLLIAPDLALKEAGFP